MSKGNRVRKSSILKTPGSKERPARRLPAYIRCMTLRKGKYYYAECIDFGLMVRRDSEEEAREQLLIQIKQYADTVKSMGYPHHLVYRRSPLKSRVLYHVCRLAKHIYNLQDRGRKTSHSLSCETLKLART